MTVTERIQDRFNARIVYGDPVEQNGVVVVPGARVMGGGGGGTDHERGEGGGFGLFASPAGAWIVRGDEARWKPAIDVLLMVGGGYLVAIAYFFFTWRIEKARARAGSK